MSYAIIGFGNIGQALSKAFARNGIEVSVATTRDPESFASAVAAIGPTITTCVITQLRLIAEPGINGQFARLGSSAMCLSNISFSLPSRRMVSN